MKALAIAIQSGVPTLLWGPPGTGKTTTIRAIASALELHCETIIASIREPADFAGLPIPSEDGVRLAPPNWAVRLFRAGRGILFLDEITTAPPAVQAALLRVVLERVVGDITLPEEVAVVAAANPPEQAAGGWDLAPALANRFCHLKWRLDVAVWCDGMVAGWPTPTIPRLPKGWEVGITAARALVASFIKARPHLLLVVPREEHQAGQAWPSPRTWDMAARLVAATKAAGEGEEVELELMAGCVGEGAALEFLSWRRSLDLPDPEVLLQNPEDFRLPARGDQQYAVLSAVVAAAAREPIVKERLAAAWRVIDLARQQGAADIAAVAARPLAQVSLRAGYVAKEAKEFLSLLKQAGEV